MIPHYEILAQYSFSSPSKEGDNFAVSHTVGPAPLRIGEKLF